MQVCVGGVARESLCNQRVWIAAHVYVCVTSDGSVILDLKRDKYYGLGREDTELLAGIVPGWPTPGLRCCAEEDVMRVDNQVACSLGEPGRAAGRRP